MFTIFHTHIGQDAAIIINNALLPNEFFTPNYKHSLSASTIHQMLEIVDKNGQSAKFSHIYQSSSHPVPKRLFAEIDDFSPDFALVDLNLTVHGKKFTDWLNTENSIFSQNIVDFKTFRSHRSRELTTTSDGITSFRPSASMFPAWFTQITCGLTWVLHHNSFSPPPLTHPQQKSTQNSISTPKRPKSLKSGKTSQKPSFEWHSEMSAKISEKSPKSPKSGQNRALHPQFLPQRSPTKPQ